MNRQIEKKLKPFSFVKMHGCGNDFVIIDSRINDVELNFKLIRNLCDRNKGIGCDQLVLITHSRNSDTYAKLKFWNSDGSESFTCGNATRCVADLLFQETKKSTLTLESVERKLYCKKIDSENISVNMGQPLLTWDKIPLSRASDSLYLPLDGVPVATGMGNPHCTFFVPNINEVNMTDLGSKYEKSSLFPDGTNVQIAQVLDNKSIQVKVWERGVGITLASGSSACAVGVAAKRRGLVGNFVRIFLDGGSVLTEWKSDGVWLTGPTKTVFAGSLNDHFLNSSKE